MAVFRMGKFLLFTVTVVCLWLIPDTHARPHERHRVSVEQTPLDSSEEGSGDSSEERPYHKPVGRPRRRHHSSEEDSSEEHTYPRREDYAISPNLHELPEGDRQRERGSNNGRGFALGVNQGERKGRRAGKSSRGHSNSDETSEETYSHSSRDDGSHEEVTHIPSRPEHSKGDNGQSRRLARGFNQGQQPARPERDSSEQSAEEEHSNEARTPAPNQPEEGRPPVPALGHGSNNRQSRRRGHEVNQGVKINNQENDSSEESWEGRRSGYYRGRSGRSRRFHSRSGVDH